MSSSEEEIESGGEKKEVKDTSREKCTSARGEKSASEKGEKRVKKNDDGKVREVVKKSDGKDREKKSDDVKDREKVVKKSDDGKGREKAAKKSDDGKSRDKNVKESKGKAAREAKERRDDRADAIAREEYNSGRDKSSRSRSRSVDTRRVVISVEKLPEDIVKAKSIDSKESEKRRPCPKSKMNKCSKKGDKEKRQTKLSSSVVQDEEKEENFIPDYIEGQDGPDVERGGYVEVKTSSVPDVAVASILQAGGVQLVVPETVMSSLNVIHDDIQKLTKVQRDLLEEMRMQRKDDEKWRQWKESMIKRERHEKEDELKKKKEQSEAAERREVRRSDDHEKEALRRHEELLSALCASGNPGNFRGSSYRGGFRGGRGGGYGRGYGKDDGRDREGRHGKD